MVCHRSARAANRVVWPAAATNSAVAEVQALATLTAPEVSYEPLAQAGAVKRRGAIIGSAPKLNAEGLIAAAELAREKEAARLKQVSPGSADETSGGPTGWGRVSSARA